MKEGNMARRTSVSTGTGLELSGFAGGPNIKDTMELVTDKLRQLAQTRIGDKPYFFPDGIQLIQLTLSLQGQAQFSLTVSGAAKSVAVEGAEEDAV
jgi:hypothetical protein